jgi:tetratricopeptide (TPR) repeat protein
MGRRETPLDSSGPLHEFALQLRELRANADLTYRQMAGSRHYSVSTFARAANGRALPPLDVTLAYVEACGGDPDRWRRFWHSLAGPVAAEPGGPRPGQLLPDVVDFVGRKEQLAHAVRAIEAGARLITVTGPPGVGTSAFGTQLAHRVRSQFPDGQLYLWLRGCRADRPAPAVALGQLLRGLGEHVDPVPADADEWAARYRSRLDSRRYLVLLDDAHDERQVRPLLAGSPCAVIVTSRNVLAGLDGARRYALGPLTEAEAVELLVRLAGKRLAGDLPNARRVVRLCGGLPLAVRIAAARLLVCPQWTVTELLDRLYAAPFDELQTGDLSVRAAFDTSYRCLDVATRVVFRRLALLPGARFGADAAEALCGPGAGAALSRLAEHNLVRAAGRRYELPHLLRGYARECLRADGGGTLRRAADRAARWYAASAVAAAQASGLPPPLLAPAPGTGFPDALAWLAAERSNLVALARTAPAPVSWMVADALDGYLAHRGRAADRRAVTAAGLLAARADPDGRATAALLIRLAGAEAAAGQLQSAVRRHHHALARSRRLAWPPGAVAALSGLGAAYLALGRLGDARACHAIAYQLGDPRALVGLAAVARAAGAGAEAVRLCGTALPALDRLGVAEALVVRAWALADDGRPADAATDARRARSAFAALGSRLGVAEAMLALAAVEPSQAPRAVRLARVTGDRRLRVKADILRGTTVSRARPTAALRIYGAALRDATRLGLAAEQVDAMLGLADAARRLGRYAAAHRYAARALDRAHRHGLGRRRRPA